MDVVATFTLWACLTVWLLLPTLGAPEFLSRAAITLMGLELFALLLWSYTAGPVHEAARMAASEDLPGLTGILVVLCVAHGVRVARGQARAG